MSLFCAFQLHGTLQIDIWQAMRRQGLGQLKCLVPLQEVAVHVQRRLGGAALKEVASGLAAPLGKRWLWGCGTVLDLAWGL